MSEDNTAKSPIYTKLVLIIFLAILLMVPVFMVGSLVFEREKTRGEAITEVSSKWGREQVITGPVLAVPYQDTERDKNGNITNVIKYAHFLPDSLNIKGDINSEIRRRGIYEIAMYNSHLKLSGKFPRIDVAALGIASKVILWNDSFVYLGVSDLVGIQESVKLNWNEHDYSFEPGIETDDVVKSGVSIKLPLNANEYLFAIDLDLNGSNNLLFVPVGKETKINLSSNWPAPSFAGSFLPDKYELNDNGFTADWKVLNLNRNFPQMWLSAPLEKVEKSAFGVNLFIPVDEYQKTTRSTKYAILIIGLTFLVFFFVEVLFNKKVHPIHYLLVGVALCIFYLLLLSISEHLIFNSAYLIAGMATIILINIYSRHILKNNKLSVIQGLIMLVMYGFVYILIQQEDYALLTGSIGIFVIWAIIMFISRRVNWYNAGK